MPANTRYPLLAGLILASCVVLTGCARTAAISAKLSEIQLNPSGWITPYRSDVVQGNFLSSEQVALLRPGMSRNDVRNVLGTPLVTSLFHADRWDYVFTLKRQGAPDQSFRYTVYFNGEALARFEGDAMPSEAEFIAKLDKRNNPGKIPSLQATPAQLEAAAGAQQEPAFPQDQHPAGNRHDEQQHANQPAHSIALHRVFETGHIKFSAREWGR